ncbi:dihydroxyacetone kinase phosphoryl donor subunit DhaM [Streptococcus massiliensis]|uniref:phosphoenolpyruvate--glycerone phosphotransferase n=1 Tax=Streptococcus massiliensis TaxID=313439 RepID=A0A380KY40_9STRE|nr:dihydroxyacetone kinase phosphoryl donor subunit DhaM [Streptococcus massiliensis]SUN76892.1 PTS system mannnose-specific transporter subunit IIA [Streptococcus massiliensis]
MEDVGIVLVSHSNLLAEGLYRLVKEVAKDVSITYVGGLEDGSIGTSFERVQAAIDSNPKSQLLAFYDLGSARMNLEMAADFSDKEIIINQVPIVEGSYTAAALIQAGTDKNTILMQLAELHITK